MTKILSWNVNSLRIRLAELERIAREENPDVVCLQEVKAKEEDFPFAAVKAAGFEHVALYGMAGYNGVAILSRRPLTGVRRFDWAGKADARHISAVTEEGIEIHNIYIPAGGDLPDPDANPAFARKLAFIEELDAYFAGRKAEGATRKMLVCGDFNVAPSENDVWNHKQLLKIVSHTPAETSRLQKWYREWSTPSAAAGRNRKKSFPGGVTATPTGKPTTKDGGWIMSGSVRRWRRSCNPLLS